MFRSLRPLVILLLAAGLLGAAERLDPVLPEKPVSDEVRQAFDEAFGPDLKAVLATPDGADDGELALRIFGDARKQVANNAAYAGYCLDQVVFLSSGAPGGQRLVYAALQSQRSSQLRPERGCLEKMMLVAPKAFAEMDLESGRNWLETTWATDAVALAQLMLAARQTEGAARMLAQLKDTAEKAKIDVPSAVSQYQEGVEFLTGLREAVQKFEAEVLAPGEHRQAQTVLGILSLSHDKKAGEALKHLQAGSEEAVALAAALEKAQDFTPKASDSLRVVRTMTDLALKTPGLYFQALLWKEAGARLKTLVDKAPLSETNKSQADMLKELIGRMLVETQGALPPLVQVQMERGPVELEAETDDFTNDQTFFGIPMKRAKRIVYLLDRSGAMAEALVSLKQELGQTVMALGNEQNFAVFFYSSGAAEALPGGLLPATGANKDKALRFIESMAPAGQADPRDALTKAFALDPDTVCLLTGGQVDKSVPGLIDQLNRAKKVSVNCVCFMNNAGEAVLKDIAQRNGGTYRFVATKPGPRSVRTDARKPAKPPSPGPRVEAPPPADKPPADKPPADKPPADKPPADKPPADKPPASDAPAADTPPVETAKPKPAPAGPMPAADLDKLERMLSYLDKNITCLGCGGTGGGTRRESSGKRIITYKVTCPDCDGTGKTPRKSLQKTIDVIQELLDKYGDGVPVAMRKRAERTLAGIAE